MTASGSRSRSAPLDSLCQYHRSRPALLAVTISQITVCIPDHVSICRSRPALLAVPISQITVRPARCANITDHSLYPSPCQYQISLSAPSLCQYHISRSVSLTGPISQNTAHCAHQGRTVSQFELYPQLTPSMCGVSLSLVVCAAFLCESPGMCGVSL